MNFVLFTIFAQAYGTSTYGQQTYSCAENQSAAECTTTAPAASDSGVAAIPPVFLLPGIALLAIVLYVGTLLAIKKLRKRNNHKG
jgi:hypothetical protein